MALKLIADDEEPEDKVSDRVPGISDMMHEFKLASDAFEDAKRLKDYWQSRLDEELQATEHKSETVDYEKDPTKRLRAVRVANRRFSVDSAGLIKKFGVRKTRPLFKDPEIDKTKLEHALRDPESEFTKDAVVDFISYTDHPYVRLYVLERREGSPDDEQPEE